MLQMKLVVSHVNVLRHQLAWGDRTTLACDPWLSGTNACWRNPKARRRPSGALCGRAKLDRCGDVPGWGTDHAAWHPLAGRSRRSVGSGCVSAAYIWHASCAVSSKRLQQIVDQAPQHLRRRSPRLTIIIADDRPNELGKQITCRVTATSRNMRLERRERITFVRLGSRWMNRKCYLLINSTVLGSTISGS